MKVFEAAGLHQGQEVVAQLGLAVALGKLKADDLAGAGLDEGVGDSLADARGVANDSQGFPEVGVGQQAVKQRWLTGAGLEVAAAVVCEYVHYVVRMTGWAGVSRGTACGTSPCGGALCGLVLAADVDGDDVGLAGARLKQAWVYASHECGSSGGEEAGCGVQWFVEELGLHGGVLPAFGFDLVGDKRGIVGVVLSHLVRSYHKHSLYTVLVLQPLESRLHFPQEIVGGSHSADVEGGGVGAGSHGGEAPVDGGLVLVLSLVDDQEQVGGGALGAGLGVAGEEGDDGLAKASPDGLGL